MNIIKQYRIDNNLSQSQFAQRFATFGVTLRTLQGWEQGRRETPAWIIALLDHSKNCKNI